jgi:amino acid adenylation domain-containing protein
MTHIAFPDADTALRETGIADDVVADFAAAARQWAHRPAIVCDGTAITYQELAERIRLTGSRYRSRQFTDDGPSGLIAALVSSTPAVVVHLLGILEAGATYCPIDAAFPLARRQELASALGVDRVFATSPDLGAATDPWVDTVDEDPAAAYVERAEASSQPDDPAYVLFTSGCTGAPKPVVVSRRALTTSVRALRHLFAITPDDRVLQFAALGWDTCLEEILPALTAGAAVVFDDAAHCGSLPRFTRMLAECQITVLDLPTAFWHELVLYLHDEGATLPAGVRLVVIGGERIDPTRLRQWRDLDTGHIGLLNTYGCTETTLITHAVPLSGPGTETQVSAGDVEIPLGRPLPHVRDHITEHGELLVSGPSLATGYLGLPHHNAIGFPVADHGAGPTRWFRTGDLVARDENGLLYPRGRADEQLKVLGVRVHPAEVEAQLNTHPAVAGAVVVGERVLGHMTLTALVVAAGAVTAAELRTYLRERLPIQFVPRRVRFVAALAYTCSGKVDRAATRRAAEDDDNRGACR